MNFKVSQEISGELVRGLLCCAFEGGSNYWCRIDERVYPAGLSAADYADGGKGQDGKSYWHWSQLLPTQAGGALVIISSGGDEVKGATSWRLDSEAIDRGLKVMAEKYPNHYGDFMAENDDATTGDVFLQCCLFGEVVFG